MLAERGMTVSEKVVADVWATSVSVFAGGGREEIHRSLNTNAGTAVPAGDQKLQGRGRSPEVQGTWRDRAPSRLFSLVPRRVFENLS